MAADAPLSVHRFATGEGVPLVLLPGFPLDHRLWEDVAVRLPADRTVLAVDPPGLGAPRPARTSPPHWRSGAARRRAVARDRRRRRRGDARRARRHPGGRGRPVDGRLHGARPGRAAPRAGRRPGPGRHEVHARRRRRPRQPPPGGRRRARGGSPRGAERHAAGPARREHPRGRRPVAPGGRVDRRADAGGRRLVAAGDGRAPGPHRGADRLHGAGARARGRRGRASRPWPPPSTWPPRWPTSSSWSSRARVTSRASRPRRRWPRR